MSSIYLLALLPLLAAAISIDTFNIGLEEAGNNQRTPAIISAINASGTDIICINEAWGGPSRIIEIIRALTPVYPYHISLVNNSEIIGSTRTYPGPCNANALSTVVGPLTACVAAITEKPFIDVVTRCFREQLAETMESNDRCWACLIEQTYFVYSKDESILTALDACSKPSNNNWIQTLGLIVLSKTEMVNVTIGWYPAFIAPRGYISTFIPGTLDDVTIQLVCTHLTPDQSLVPYIADVTTPYSSWGQENGNDTILLVEFLRTTKRADSIQVVLGDFNHGPAVNGLEGTFSAAFDVMNATGMYNPFLLSIGLCTACVENNVFSNPGNLYDHIWLSTSNITGTVSRVYDYLLHTNGGWECANPTSTYCTGCVLTMPSDHYGVRVNFTLSDYNDVVVGDPPRPNITSCMRNDGNMVRVDMIGLMAVMAALCVL